MLRKPTQAVNMTHRGVCPEIPRPNPYVDMEGKVKLKSQVLETICSIEVRCKFAQLYSSGENGILTAS